MLSSKDDLLMIGPILSGVLLAIFGIVAGWVKCFRDPAPLHSPATVRQWLALVRPQGWLLFAAIPKLTVVNPHDGRAAQRRRA
jgi:hypothetical protein